MGAMLAGEQLAFASKPSAQRTQMDLLRNVVAFTDSGAEAVLAKGGGRPPPLMSPAPGFARRSSFTSLRRPAAALGHPSENCNGAPRSRTNPGRRATLDGPHE